MFAFSESLLKNHIRDVLVDLSVDLATGMHDTKPLMFQCLYLKLHGAPGVRLGCFGVQDFASANHNYLCN